MRDKALVVPEEALVPQGGKQYLVKVIETPNGKVTQRIEAKLGLRVPGKAEIVEGLSPGDVVITAGQSKVMRADGLPIKVVEIGAPSGRTPNGPAGPASGPAGGVV
jgi:membrane fusion protein, multidrug efflux system